MKRLFFLTLLISINVLAQAKEKILLISDIDDTIKVSHVISYKSWSPSVLFRTWDSNTPFAGMASLYQLVLNENPGVNKVAYLSNAPSKDTGVEYLQNSHENFLKNNSFPQGELILRDVIFDSDHKNKTIRKLVAEHQPTLVMMVGDNGEKDVDVYEQARKELEEQGIKSVTYIHQLYSSRDKKEIGKMLHPGQTGYATSVEIALDLHQKGLRADAQMTWMYEKVIPYIFSVRNNLFDVLTSISFPSFKKCDDFQWTWSTKSHPSLPDYKEYVQDTCQ